MSRRAAARGTVGGWTGEAVAVFVKEWRIELRTRHALFAILLFAVTTLLTLSLALGPLGAASSERVTVLPVLLWVVLLFAAAIGLPRSFVHEEDTHTATALRLAATPSALFAGKLLYSATLLWALELVAVPLFLAMMQLAVALPATLVVALLAGGLGLAAASTLIAAMVAQAEGRGALFPILAFPILLPLLLLAVGLTRAAVSGVGDPAGLSQLLLYDAALVVAGLMLFPLVWNP
ncbi:MAG TPA: heme exporter protein CcmB [Thermoanaerobaculia bacterium]|nr:heme exporter protein CcmB [Thermoanaerobaculia bacterium]